MVRPQQIFLLSLLLLVLLAIPALFAPPDGFRIGGITLRYPRIAELFSLDTLPASPQAEGLHPELVQLGQMLDTLALEAIEPPGRAAPPGLTPQLGTAPPLGAAPHDTATGAQPAEAPATLALGQSRTPLELPDTSWQALEGFYSALAQGLPAEQLVRVLHFGDSQIEGDRVSSFLRARLQAQFGGRGVGLLHAVPHSHQPAAIHQTHSANWRQVLLADMARGPVGYRFGLLGGYSVFADTRALYPSGGFARAWIRIQRRGAAQSFGRHFTGIRIFYGYNPEPFMVSIAYGDQTRDAEIVPPTAGVKQLAWPVPTAHSTLQLDFKGDQGPMVFGISLESASGVMVDNIPIRGGTGIDFTRADQAVLRQMMAMLNVRLIILQFGVNMVPHVVESYAFYEEQLHDQIVALRRASPGASVVLIGVSDMARKEGGRFVSFPNIERIRDAQRRAAHRGGAAFWDSYRAMGGQHSMVAWAHADPPLASRDFVHFTPRGARLIAEMFYSALMGGYQQYLLAQRAAGTPGDTIPPR